MKPQFLIAAPHSGAGKTTVTLGILRALRNQGLNVQPFKCGPDYLDPKLHTLASGMQSINLDRFMMDDAHINELYTRYGNGADVVVTEGVMGLFDGSVKMEGSSADLARLLNIPVIMVINAKAMAYSVAALLLGFKTLCPDIHIAGVIFNFVEHESHYRMLKEAAEDIGITSMGYLPNSAAIQIPSRHLGLKTGTDVNLDAIIERAASHIKKHIDLKKLMETTMAPLLHTTGTSEADKENTVPKNKTARRILIANDEAFNFTYAENIAALSALGQLSYFSPLNDFILPPADLVYLPGGYPELHLEELSRNTALRDQLYAYHANGGKILAECGGMMYLGEYIADEKGTRYPMVGILEIATGMQQKKLSLGYKRINIDGLELRGHEFHYSQFIDISIEDTTMAQIIQAGTANADQIKSYTPKGDRDIQIWNARNEQLQLPVFHTSNLLASYFHFYFGNKVTALETLLFSQVRD